MLLVLHETSPSFALHELCYQLSVKMILNIKRPASLQLLGMKLSMVKKT